MGILFLLLAWMELVSAGVDLRDYCTKHPNAYVVHPEDCSKFVTCVSGGNSYVQSCPGGMYFSNNHKACDFKQRVSCSSESIADPTTRPHPSQRPESKPKHQQARQPHHHEAHRGGRNDFRSHGYSPYIPPWSRDYHDQGYYGNTGGYRYRDPTTGYYGHSYDSRELNADLYRYPYDFKSASLRPHGLLKPTISPRYRPESSPERVTSKERKKPESREKLTLKDDGMVHFVHDEKINFDLLKRIRRPGEPPLEGHTKPVAKSSERGHRAHYPEHNGKCHHGKDGLFKHPTRCTMYLQCTRGRSYEKPCPPGTFFNPTTSNCGFNNGDCDDEERREVHQAERESKEKPQYKDSGNSESEEDADMMDDILESLADIKHLARRNTRSVFKREAEMAGKMSYRRGGFSGVAGFLGSTSHAKQLGIPAYEQLEVLRILKDRFKLDVKYLHNILEKLPRLLETSDNEVSPDMDTPKMSPGYCPYPRNTDKNNCDSHIKYRTFDGSCNNLRRPLWGKSFMPLARFLTPDYADGIQAPRAGARGYPLPSARAVSLAFFEDHDVESHVHTLMHMTFGQFLDHDLARTAVTMLTKNENGVGAMMNVMCGESECETEGIENRACLPIELPPNDPDFSHTNKTCLMFVRTQEVMQEDCKLGARQQLNQLTSHMDSSMVYGSNKTQADALRDLSEPDRGKLKLRPHPYGVGRYKGLLPSKFVKDCRGVNDTIECFTAGDGRLNEHVGLAALHHIFHRGHNTIEEELHRLNPHWDGERLFQESRRILNAAWQKVVYAEYLPLVLGPQEMNRFGLNLLHTGYFDGYDDTVNTANANSFTTAAFRFGHSQIHEMIRFAARTFADSADKEVKLSTVLRRPFHVYNTALPGGTGVDSVTLGHCSQAAQKTDRFFTKQITKHLFSENPPKEPGTDLGAINTQRGRDHGLPGYNRWRKWCGLRPARTWADFTDLDRDAIDKLRSVYRHVDDVDLFVAGVAEKHVPGGMIGPTFACIIGRQFRNLRVGDRFWHENRDPYIGFSPDQLQQIRRFTLSRFICDNLDDVAIVQPLPMLQPLSEAFKRLGRKSYQDIYSLASLYQGQNNERTPCTRIPRPNLAYWKENRDSSPSENPPTRSGGRFFPRGRG